MTSSGLGRPPAECAGFGRDASRACATSVRGALVAALLAAPFAGPPGAFAASAEGAVAAAATAAAATDRSATLGHAALVDRFADPDSRFATLDDVVVHYKDQGSGPSVLLIHGSVGDLWDWDRWVGRLAPRYRLVRFDMPAAGLAGPVVNGNLSVERVHTLIDALMDRLRIERFAVVGSSFGGVHAFRYAATRRDRVSALVLMNSAGVEPGRQRDASAASTGSYGFATGSDASADFMRIELTRMLGDPALVTEALLARKLAFRNADGRSAEAALAIRQFVRGEPETVLAKVRAPTLVLWGGSNPVLSVNTADRFVELLRGAAVVRKKVYPQGVHLLPLQIPDETAADALAFLDEVVPRP